MPTLIVIAGPTASGKTRAAISLAKHLRCPIISADSRQFFKEMNIGTAKPNAEELSEAQHFFINNKSIDEEYSAGKFEQDALDLLAKLFEIHTYVLLVGGSGLYIDALVKGMDDLPKNAELRETLNKRLKVEGFESLRAELEEIDSVYYRQCDNQNPHRVVRALEIIHSSGKKMGEQLTFQQKKRPFDVKYIVLDLPREVLYERINQRVDNMIKSGLLEEVESLIRFKHKNALQTVGYQEIFDFFENKIDLDTAINLVKQNSRRYAKRQITWFKRIPETFWLDPEEFNNPSLILSKIGLS